MCRSTLDNSADNFIQFGESTTKTIRRKNGVVRIDFPTYEARVRCLKHYLQRKKKEYEAAADAPRNVLNRKFAKGRANFSRSNRVRPCSTFKHFGRKFFHQNRH